eukprot:CAMPEP_0202694946 /NCGR_PEP_ID=MMETSP1385-20130828/8670_1 /ASSEMBLY_ACC=CAM_ASM_000861 /TAXON_ID=933848 /ORGANISM="Elphidium margaritaceum" /LENGTH=387 /DNA_ID=CAMNT_0049350887 /DNA_START=75 /DNA_END=1238 /DNA_ORIENTATION=-
MSKTQNIPLMVDDANGEKPTKSEGEAEGGAQVMLTAMNNYQTIKDEKKVMMPGMSVMSREEVPPCPNYVYVPYYIFMLGGPFLLTFISYIYVENWEEYLVGVGVSVAMLLGLGWIIGAIFYNLCGISSNYTRKIGHLGLFVLPVVFAGGFDAWQPSEDDEQPTSAFELNFNLSDAYQNIIIDMLWAAYQSQIFVFLMSRPLRRFSNYVCGDTRSKRKLRWCNCCENMMDAFERPEDRPNHLLWLNTQLVLYYVGLFCLSFWWNDIDSGVQVLIPTFISGIGDGLAEPVGVKFGKNCCGRDCRYKTHGCCSKYDYVRSVPGSLMVLLSGYLGVLVAQSQYSTWQFVIAMIFIPPLGTVVEAKAPHTLDNPFIAIIVGVAATSILYIPV